MGMTCVIGLVEEGKIYMGADSAVSNGWQVDQTARSKVFRVGEFLIGTCGSVRVSGLLRSFSVRKMYVGEDCDEYMVVGVAEAIRKCMKDGGVVIEQDGDRMAGRSTAIIGFHSKLYFLGNNFHIDRYIVPFMSIGLGSLFAMGAMRAYHGLPPEKRIRESLKVAAFFSEGVRPPFVVRKM